MIKISDTMKTASSSINSSQNKEEGSMINLKDIKVGDVVKLSYYSGSGQEVFHVVRVVNKGKTRARGGWLMYSQLDIHGSPISSHESKIEEDQFHNLEALPEDWGGFVPSEAWESISSPREAADRALAEFPYRTYYGAPRGKEKEQMIRWLAAQDLPEEAHIREILLAARDSAGRLDALRDRVGLVPGQVRQLRAGGKKFRVDKPSREIFSPQGAGMVWTLSMIAPTRWEGPTIFGLEDEILAKSDLVDDSAASWLAW